MFELTVAFIALFSAIIFLAHVIEAYWGSLGLKANETSELEPTPELPDNMPIREVRFPTRIKDTLFAPA
jgi:hypothetical protein